MARKALLAARPPSHVARTGSRRGSLGMIVLVLAALAAASSLAAGTAGAQIINTESQLGIELAAAQPVHSIDDDGHVVVIGEVLNLRDFPVTDVRVLVSYYTAESDEVAAESRIGNTILEVLPASGSSAFIVRSASPIPDIANVSVDLLGFTSSPTKPVQLDVGSPAATAFGRLDISGTVENSGPADAENPRIYALVYDALVPPRLIGAHTLSTEIPAGSSYDYEFSLPDYEQAAFVRIVAESDNITSDSADAPIDRSFAYSVVIQNIETVDSDGRIVSALHEGEPVYISSTIRGTAQGGAEYQYIVQIKSSTALPLVEFVGSSEGGLLASGIAKPLIEWTPSSPGLFFIETYVWSPEGVPISTPGPVALVHVR